MASQFRFGSQMTSSPFGGFSTSSQRPSTQESGPAIPSQPNFRVITMDSQHLSNVDAEHLRLYNADAALLAPGTSEMASVVSSTNDAVSQEFDRMKLVSVVHNDS